MGNQNIRRIFLSLVLSISILAVSTCCDERNRNNDTGTGTSTVSGITFSVRFNDMTPQEAPITGGTRIVIPGENFYEGLEIGIGKTLQDIQVNSTTITGLTQAMEKPGRTGISVYDPDTMTGISTSFNAFAYYLDFPDAPGNLCNIKYVGFEHYNPSVPYGPVNGGSYIYLEIYGLYDELEFTLGAELDNVTLSGSHLSGYTSPHTGPGWVDLFIFDPFENSGVTIRQVFKYRDE